MAFRGYLETDRLTKTASKLEPLYRMKICEVHRSVRRDKRNYINALAAKVEEAASRCDSRTAYKITKELTGGRSSSQHPVKGLDGSLLISNKEQHKGWKEHFATVLNCIFANDMHPSQTEVPEATNTRTRTTTPSKDEITTAIKALKNSKAVGLDGILAELLRAAPTTSAELLLPLVERAWEAESFPDERKEGMMVKLRLG